MAALVIQSCVSESSLLFMVHCYKLHDSQQIVKCDKIAQIDVQNVTQQLKMFP